MNQHLPIIVKLVNLENIPNKYTQVIKHTQMHMPISLI